MNDHFYPLIGGSLQVDVSGSWGRAMKKDAVHLAPPSCRDCPNLTLSRDDLRAWDILHCNQPSVCSYLIEDCPPEVLFVDVRPVKGILPADSPCWNCEHRHSSVHGPGGQLLHWCNRREKKIEDCIVRGQETPEIFNEKSEARDSAQLEHELELIELIDQTDYGTF